jgi:hypothetical protein
MTLGAEPFLDQPQDPLVRDPMLEEPLQPALIELGEEVTDVRVEHPVHPLAFDRDRERVQRTMPTPPRPEPIRETEKVLLLDRVQHLDHRPLDDLVLQRSDPGRARSRCPLASTSKRRADPAVSGSR